QNTGAGGSIGLVLSQSTPHAQIVADDSPLVLSRPSTSGPAVYGLNPMHPQCTEDVYSSVTEPHRYHAGFHFFFQYIGARMDKRNILRVSRAIARFRPSLVALLRNLTREDLLFTEKSLQRALLEYEKLIGFVGTPTVVWRRSGEIMVVGKEFSILTQWARHELTTGDRYIYELMDTESAVVYWEQFAEHAFENSEHSVMSECRLMRPDGGVVPCAFSFTIKRDLFGIPMAIIGNFLPVLTGRPALVPAPHPARDGQPLNVHSRAAAREQLRQQQGAGGVLADLHALHGQQSRGDMRAVFTASPRDSASASAYVSGHLTPTDQWVAVGSESSGVISLTTSDTEDDDPRPAHADRNGKTPDFASEPAAPANPQPTWQPERAAAAPVGDLDADQQAVHLLRESVASLLSSAGSPTSSSVMSSRRARPPLPPWSAAEDSTASSSGGGQRGRRHRRSQSPSTVSKISEPCYLPSAPRRRFAAGFDHFSDIALSTAAATAPPSEHPRGDIWQHGPHIPSRGADRHARPAVAAHGDALDESGAELRRRGVSSSGAADVSAAATTLVAASAAYHPLLADDGEGRRAALGLPASPSAARSPFASIRTVSPVLIPAPGTRPRAHQPPCELDLLARAQAEAALEHTILCPLERPAGGSRFVSHGSDKGADARKDAAAPEGDSSGTRQAWAKYTGYAIVGFGVGTLVGMMCFDMAATSPPRATRTIPIASL
ncbi:Transcriptional regulator of nonfermentable carbon utilization, partial [Coemansia biformis]